jgi:hypothetical protein
MTSTRYGYTPDRNFYGYEPDEFAPQDVAAFDAMAQRYDPTGQPAIVSWSSIEPVLYEQAKTMDAMRTAGWQILWWRIAKHAGIPMWDSNQGQIGSCAGWSVANGHMALVLYQMMLGAFRFERIDPLAMWVINKNWSMSGGQSMSAVMTGGNQHGNFPVRNVGEYVTRMTPDKRNRIESARGEARLHQIGACRLPGTGREMAQRIVQCVRAGLTVPIGNNIAVSGSTVDRNGMRIATLGGSWMHATVFCGYAVVNGTVYVYWMNSHGNRYRGADRFGAPESGCWMTLEVLERFCSGRFVDVFAIYRSEAPVDTERKDFTPATFNENV